MPTPGGWISLAIVVATLALILIRPRRLSEAISASLGAGAVLLSGGLPLDKIPGLLRETSDVLIFLAGMMLLTVIVEQAGVFDVVAEWCARISRGSGIALFVIVFVLGAVVTALLSLDVTVIVLTPIVYAITIRRRLDPLPFMFACTFVANTSSLVFPMSNLTNLLLYSQLDLDFGDFTRAMWLPNLVALATNLIVFLWLFRTQIPKRFEFGGSPDLPPVDWWFVIASVVLIITLVALVGLGFRHEPLSAAAASGAIFLTCIGLAGGRIRLPDVVRQVSWPVLAFVVGMLIVVRGLERQWLDVIDIHLPGSPLGALALGAALSAIGSNIVNNVPMALLSIPAIERTPAATREVSAYATLLGCNIGPTMTTYGSLATMLWLSLVRRRGIDVTTRQYLRVGLLTAPIVLLTSSVALWWSMTR